MSDFNQLGIRDAQEVSLSLPPSQARFLAAEGVGNIAPWKRVNVELLQSPECTDAFPPSPYIEQARLNLKRNLEAMTEAATRTSLVLVDYDFERGHGAQVRKVVDDLLAGLGVPSLGARVFNFDLKPRNWGPNTVGDPLQKAMGEYSSYLEHLNVDYRDQRSNAADWLVFFKDLPSGSTVVPIAPFALQAAVAVNLKAGAWLNLSWRGSSAEQVMPVQLSRLLHGNEVFAVVAAGNDTEIMLDLAPQSEALRHSQFVNVTNGTAKGEVCGSRTSSEGGGVDLLAHREGVDSAQKRVSASSFASPVVATAAWLKHLIDETPASRMRQQLVSASSYMPALNTRTVAARGVFDPARLLANLGPHYIAAGTGEAVEFQTMELDLGFCGLFRHLEGTEAVKDLVIYERAGKHEVAVRTAMSASPYAKEADVCEVPSLRFSMNLLSGETRTATTPKAFLEMVRQLHF